MLLLFLIVVLCNVYCMAEEVKVNDLITLCNVEYLLLKELGGGFDGTVFQTNVANVAIKVVSHPREAEIMKRLSVHPNIIRFYCSKTTSSHTFIALEYIEGGTVEDLVSQEEPRIDEAVVWNWLGQISQGLLHLKQQRIVHQDLKLGNFLLTKDHSRLVIGDFGQSILLLPREKYHEDLWSIGASLYRIFTGITLNPRKFTISSCKLNVSMAMRNLIIDLLEKKEIDHELMFKNPTKINRTPRVTGTPA